MCCYRYSVLLCPLEVCCKSYNIQWTALPKRVLPDRGSNLCEFTDIHFMCLCLSWTYFLTRVTHTHIKPISLVQCWNLRRQKHTIDLSPLCERGGWCEKLLRERPISPGNICATRDHLENHQKIRREEGRVKERNGVYGLIMSLEIIPVLVRSYCRAQGDRSMGRSPGLWDSEDWVVSILLVC